MSQARPLSVRLVAGILCPLALVALLWGVPSPVSAQLPTARLDVVFPAGGKVGSQVNVKIRGADLDEVSRLNFSHEGITATLEAEPESADDKKKAKPSNTEADFTVKIAGDVPPGVYEARAVGRFGMSNPRAFVVGTLDEVAEDGKNDSRDSATEITAPTLINATFDKEAIDYYRISAKAGQRLTLDCWAQRIDSKADATLALLDGSGNELALVRDTEGLDPVLSFEVPSDGDYTIAAYDFTYEGGPEYSYRLAVHEGPRVDFVFPPVAAPGQSTKHTAYGRNLPGGQPAEEMNTTEPVEQVAVDIAMPEDDMSRQQLEFESVVEPHGAAVDGRRFAIESPAGPSNAVTIAYATAPVVVETEPNSTPAEAQGVEIPCEYVGQFFPQGDRDWIRFEANKGDVFWIEVISHRMGSGADPMLVVEQVTKSDQGESAKQIAEVDDAAAGNADALSVDSKDPAYRFEAKEDGAYRVLVYDLYDNPAGDPRAMYRLAIRQQQPDFRLVALAPVTGDGKKDLNVSSVVLRRGGTAAIDLKVLRRDGFAGEIEVTAEGLPAGLTCPPVTIAAGEKEATLVLAAAADAAAWAGPVQIVGRSQVDGKELVRQARFGSLVWGSSNMQTETPTARLTRDLGVAVIEAETAPASVALGDGNMVDVKIGEKVDVPVKVARHGDFKDPLKLSVVGLPKDIKVPEVNVTGEEATLTIDLSKVKMREGTYTVLLKGSAKIKYSRGEGDKPKDVNVDVLSTPVRVRVAAK